MLMSLFCLVCRIDLHFFLLRATAVVRRLHKGGMIALRTSLMKSRFNLFLTESKLHVEAQI